MIRLVTGSATLVGRVRSANEDSMLVADDLVVVADGMGGHLAGEVASADAVEIVGAAAGHRSLVELVSSVHLANRRINERAADDPQLHGMGTTVCAVGVVDEGGEQLAVLNVGDSRVYLFAAGQLHQLTEDHSLVETLVREGRITVAEAEVHPQRNVLTRALGVEALVVVDAWVVVPCDGDRLLLCSDGLFNELDHDRIEAILAEGDPPDVTARRLAAEADAAGGRDNITAAVIDVHDSGNPPEPLADRSRRIATPTVDLDDFHRDPANDTATVPMVPVAPVPDSDDAALDEDVEGDVAAEPDDDADDVDVDSGGGEPATTVERPTSGDDSESVPDDAVDPDAAAPTPAAGVTPSAERRRSWRTPAFILAVLLVLGVAAGLVVAYSGRGWFVGADGATVAIFRGQPDSFLWFEATVAESTDLELSELRPNDRSDVERRRRRYDDRAQAEAYLQRLRDSLTTTTAPRPRPRPTTTTTTTTTTAPPTTAPAPPGTPP